MTKDRASLRTPILDVLLQESQNISLVLPIEIAKAPKFEMYFFRVFRRFPLHRTYDSEMPSIGAGATLASNYIGDDGFGTGDDLFELWEERPFRVYHFGIGIRPGEIWLYKEIPAGVLQTGLSMKTPSYVGDKRDYISGLLSPYDEPTVATETVLYHKLSMYLGFKNDSARAIRPSLRFLGAGYDLIPLKENNVLNAMLSGRIPCRFLTMGGLKMFTFVTPDEWSPYKVEVDAKKIEEVLAR